MVFKSRVMKLEKTNTINLTSKCVEALDDFVGQIEVKKFRIQLRNLLLNYLVNEYEEPSTGFENFIQDMKFTFDFLDVIEAEKEPKETAYNKR